MKNDPITLEQLNKIERFFCDSLAVDPQKTNKQLSDEFDRLSEDMMWEFSTREKSEGIVATTLSRIRSNVQEIDRWKEAENNVGAKIGMYMQELDRAADMLSDSGIEMIALKNSGIARALGLPLSACPMGDLDVLVDPEKFQKADNVLRKNGYVLDDRSPFGVDNLNDAIKQGGAEYKIELEEGELLWFELQFRPVAGRWIQADQEPSPLDLISRSQEVEGSKVRILSGEDNLVQVCLHTAKHSFVRAPGFRLHTDVDRIVSHCDIDWNKFCSMVEELNVKTPVYISLYIPKKLLGTKIPDWVISRMNTSPIKNKILLKWIRRVGLFSPDEKKWSKLGFIVFNILLYDNFVSVFKAIFPSFTEMKNKYEIKSSWALPYVYLLRIHNLLFKRART